jgi:Rod binding domain-containing protein
MGRAQAAAGATDEARARDAAEQLVTQTFLSPLLKQLRESSDMAPPFAPSPAEKQFRALTDAELAQRIVHASRFPLVDVLARNLLKKGGKDKAGRSAADELSAARTPMPTRPAQK